MEICSTFSLACFRLPLVESFHYVSVFGCELDEVEERAELEFRTFFSHPFVEELQEVEELFFFWQS